MNAKEIEKINNDPIKYSKTTSIENLEKIIRRLSYLYYNTSKSPISDEIFDILKEALEKRNPNSSVLKEIGSPISKEKIKLPFQMGSLDKIKPEMNTLNNWVKKYVGPYEISDKLDGISAMLYKKDGVFTLYSRGDGKFGQNITHLIGYIINDTVKLNDIPEGTAVRGELIMSKKNFDNALKIAPNLKNARNTVSGIVNSKTLDTALAELVSFVTYNVINPRYKQSRQYKYLMDWGFNVVNHKRLDNINQDILSKYLEERRKASEYDIDGIVVMDDSDIHSMVNMNPEYGFAFKTIYTDQFTETVVIKVEWNVSMDGYLKPKIKVKPVELVGVTIQCATAHNAKFIFDNKIGSGAVVKLVRSGDVIPKIMEVIKPSTSGLPEMPSIPYKWNETNVDIIVKDILGAQKDNISVKRIVFFFKTLDIKFIDEGIVTKLVDAGYNDVIGIIGADEKDIVKIIGEKLTSKIFKNIIDGITNTQLHKLMAASHLFGRGLGEKKLKIVTDKYPNVMNEKWNNDELHLKINSLEGFQDKTTDKFVEGLNEFKKFFEKLSEVIEIDYLKAPVAVTTQGKLFEGKNIVMTGFRDKEMKEYIENQAGQVKESVSGHTTFVIVSTTIDSESTKLKKAKELNIPIMSDVEFRNKYMLTKKDKKNNIKISK